MHVQTLDGHKAKVNLVRWAPRPPVSCTVLEDDPVMLATADITGQCELGLTVLRRVGTLA